MEQDKNRRLVYEGDYPPVTAEQAEQAASDLIAHFFKSEPRKGGGVLIGIPARPDQDTDLLLMRFIREAARLEKVFRIRVWNEVKELGMTDDTAIAHVRAAIQQAKTAPEPPSHSTQGDSNV